MNKLTVEAIKAHAVECYPNEACGLIVAVGRKDRYVPCKNIAPKGKDQFAIDPKDYAIAEDMGEILAIVHSHPDITAKPSEADLVSCEETGIPWIIVSVFSEGVQEVRRIEPKGYKAPLLQRPFYYGVLDCFTIIQDFYVREFGIFIERFPSEDGWWEGDQEIYLDNFEAAGFVKVTDGTLQFGDVILMQARSSKANHSGVFIGSNGKIKEAPDLFPVPDAMIHHFHGRLSERVPYQGWYKDITRMVIRHKELM